MFKVGSTLNLSDEIYEDKPWSNGMVYMEKKHLWSCSFANITTSIVLPAWQVPSSILFSSNRICASQKGTFTEMISSLPSAVLSLPIMPSHPTLRVAILSRWPLVLFTSGHSWKETKNRREKAKLGNPWESERKHLQLQSGSQRSPLHVHLAWVGKVLCGTCSKLHSRRAYRVKCITAHLIMTSFRPNLQLSQTEATTGCSSWPFSWLWTPHQIDYTCPFYLLPRYFVFARMDGRATIIMCIYIHISILKSSIDASIDR